MSIKQVFCPYLSNSKLSRSPGNNSKFEAFRSFQGEWEPWVNLWKQFNLTIFKVKHELCHYRWAKAIDILWKQAKIAMAIAPIQCLRKLLYCQLLMSMFSLTYITETAQHPPNNLLNERCSHENKCVKVGHGNDNGLHSDCYWMIHTLVRRAILDAWRKLRVINI